MTSFDYAYKLEAVRDWLFAQTKLSVPLLALLLSFFGLIFVFLIYPENAPPVKSGALYQNTNISVLFSVLKPILDAPLTGSASVRRPSQPLPPDRACSGILYLKKRPAPLLESAPFLLPQKHHTPSLRLAFICFFCSYIFSSALRKTSSAL